MLALLAGCDVEQSGEPVLRTEIGEAVAEPPKQSTNERSACRSVTFENVPLTHCIADPAEHHITMELGAGTGGREDTPYRNLAILAQSRGPDAPGVAFAVNGGMYDGEGRPIGYYVEGGNRTKELSLSDGPGNFHMKPNGVFFGADGKWQIMASDEFYRTVGDRPDFGTQSGPMLVVDGALHPRIANDGPSKAIRNGVGIDKKGHAHFVISDNVMSFGQLARFFRDELKVPNALFLDGNVSSLWDPANDRLDRGAPIGPMIVVEKARRAER